MNCAGERNRRVAGKRDSVVPFGRDSGSEPLSALGAARTDHRSPATSTHANEEAVRALALDDRGLEGAFGGHDQDSCVELRRGVLKLVARL